MAEDRFIATPTLVLGIGGTGLKVATFVKKSLLEANRNILPAQMALLVLDTENEIKFKAGGWGKARGQHHATGPVSIDYAGEYLPLTGNVRELAHAIKNEQIAVTSNPKVRDGQSHRHYNDWFQAQYYIDKVNIDDALWNLDVGAGRFRQFGRIALFSKMRETLNLLGSCLNTIKQSGGTKINVHIAGSLAGGTGAALFIDLPHLVKQLAASAGLATPVVFGHFVLPEGFRGTPQVQINDSGVRQDFDARCYAALRELTRLQGPVIATAHGYPLTYDLQGTGVTNSKLRTSPYSAVYLYDGKRDNNPLYNRSIEEGIAPAIADVIVAYIDDRSSGAFCSHSVNYKASYSAHNIPDGQVTYGSVGAYTIELPIYHITEGWAHTLALEVLDTLLAPSEREYGDAHGLPLVLDTGKVDGKELNAHSDAENWLKIKHTPLIEQLVDWGIQAQRTSILRQQAVDAVLSLDAEQWQQKLAPSNPDWLVYVNEAQNELQSSLQDKDSTKYYVNHNQPGNTLEQKAGNLQVEVETKLRQMVGDPDGAWQRLGGDFRRVLVRLGHHHVDVFEETLIKWLISTLNGTIGTPIERKQGKLGYVRAFLEYTKTIFESSAGMLVQANEDSQTKRKPVYNGIEDARKEQATKMHKKSGFRGANLKAYRDKSDELAQFYKAEIVRQVVYDLVKRLQGFVAQALEEVKRWEGILGTSKASAGGAYALLLEGQKEIELDRAKAANATRWVIADDESGDTYIAEKYQQYTRDKLEQIFDNLEWKVGRVDGNGPLQIEFEQGDKQWDRRAGNKNQQVYGLKNVALLLDRCREVYETAWSYMSVTAYLRHNYADQIETLAKKIHGKSGLLLSFQPNESPPMHTTFMRVFKTSMDTYERRFLTQLRGAVEKQFRETTTVQVNTQRAEAESGQGYVSESGEDSRDRFKLTFVMFGDLLRPEQIAAYVNARTAYQTISNRGNGWKVLHILPAETNALEIERQLSSGTSETRQKRRELTEEIVATLENIALFRLLVRCLAYGEMDYLWRLEGERGVLLHKYTPPEENPESLGYWRLTVQPEGYRHADGLIYTKAGNPAAPVHYQLSQMQNEPDLLQAFIQFTCVGKVFGSDTEIALNRVEATLQQMMNKHRDLWVNNRNIVDLLDLNSRTTKDAGLLEEAEDKAAQIIRLNALMKKADAELDKQKWAWSSSGGQPPTEGIVEIQQNMDLWTAIRWVALEEMESLGNRLAQLGEGRGWHSGIPSNHISLQAGVSKNENIVIEDVKTEQVGKNEWLCSCGHTNSIEDNFCIKCQKRRPAAVVEELPIGDDSTLKRQRLQTAFENEILTREEYERKLSELEAEEDPYAERRQWLQTAFENEILTREEYERKLRELG